MPRYRARRLTITQLFTGAGVALLFVFIFGPLIWLMVWAFAGVWHYPALLPQQWSLSWWRQVFNYPQLTRSVVLSFIFAPVVTALSAVVCLPAAYAFARFDVPGRRGLMIMLFSANAFPKIGLYITIATLFYALHLMGTFFGVVLIQLLGTIVFMTWIPTAAFAAVPRTGGSGQGRGCGAVEDLFLGHVAAGCSGDPGRCRPRLSCVVGRGAGHLLGWCTKLRHDARPNVLARQ